MHSIFLVSSNASKPNLLLYSYGNFGFFIQQNKFIVIYNASVIAFQEKIPSIFKGCYCCYKSKKYRRRRPTQKYTILSILLLAATTGLVPVLLLRCCPRRSSPSWHLKVPIICRRVPTSEKMAGYMTTLRIYNDPNDKRTFIKQMVPDFQEYKDISDFKASVFELTKENFSDKKISLQDVKIGFIGGSNQKSFVTTSPQVYDAYNSRFLHKHELVLFKKRHKEKGQSRRSSSTLNGK